MPVTPELMSVHVTLHPDSAEHSSPRAMFPLPDSVMGLEPPPYAVVPRGRILVKSIGGNNEPLHVIFNWPALVK
jgi:hypothetical protein